MKKKNVVFIIFFLIILIFLYFKYSEQEKVVEIKKKILMIDRIDQI